MTGRRVAVVTDSAASLPATLIEERGIAVVPLRLRLDSESGGPPEEVLDNSIPTAEAIRRTSKHVETSGPPPGAFTTAIEETGADEVIVLTIASRMSSTFDAARIGAGAAEARTAVVDTMSASGAEALVVLAAADAAAAGGDLAEVEAAARDAAGRVHLVAAVEGLDALVRSGRVPGIAGRAGNLLGVRPLFEFRGGKAHPLGPAHGADHARNAIIRRWQRSRERDAALHVVALHAEDRAGAADLLDRVLGEETAKTSFIAEFSPVMVVHTGPLVGLAWWYQPSR